MPENSVHAIHLDFSFDHDFLATYTKEIVAYCEKYPIWYAFKHETGDNGKLHTHLVLVFEILTKMGDKDKDGSMSASNCKAHLVRRCPKMQQMLAEHGSRYSICAHPCYSDYFIEYMQKEGDLQYCKLPKDIKELQPYFADLLKNKPLSADFEKWTMMYHKDKRVVPATFDSVWEFFGQHMYNPDYKGDIKVLSDLVKLDQRTEAMVHYLNGTVPRMLKKRKQDEQEDFDVPRHPCRKCDYMTTYPGPLCAVCAKM